jgi:hypothetical protein
MKKIIKILTLAGLVSCSVNDWQLKIVADLPITDRAAIQYAIVDFNPKEEFVKEVNSAHLQNTLKSTKTNNEKNPQITVAIVLKWDLLFNRVTADKLGLLNNKDTNYIRTTGGIFWGSSKKLWLVTKSFTIEGKPYCYVIPFVVSKGSSLSCKLDQTNLIPLTELYQQQIAPHY